MGSRVTDVFSFMDAEQQFLQHRYKFDTYFCLRSHLKQNQALSVGLLFARCNGASAEKQKNILRKNIFYSGRELKIQ